MADTSTRARFGYLTYNDMLQKIQDGVLDGYDVCFTKDTNECFIINEDLRPSPVRSRVYVFASIKEAIEILNQNTDTYNGQVVAILNNEVYRGYIVNTKNGRFIVTPLGEYTDDIDYDTIGNRPIINITGTLDKPIMVSDLDNGIYRIKGQYKISNLEETVYLSASEVIITVAKIENGVTIKQITSDEVTDYTVTDTSIDKNIYITEQYLKDNNYVTNSYVDSKIEALEAYIREDIKAYVKSIVDDLFTEELDSRIDARIDEKINPMDESQINNLF